MLLGLGLGLLGLLGLTLILKVLIARILTPNPNPNLFVLRLLGAIRAIR